MLRVLVFVIALLFAGQASARDLGQWGDEDSVIREWYKGLMQPDVPDASCCGEGDAYWCDDYYYDEKREKAYCKITDDRDDEPRKRKHIPIGTEIEIPPYKLKYDRGNPTGHSIVFVSPYITHFVFCFVQSTGG